MMAAGAEVERPASRVPSGGSPFLVPAVWGLQGVESADGSDGEAVRSPGQRTLPRVKRSWMRSRIPPNAVDTARPRQYRWT